MRAGPIQVFKILIIVRREIAIFAVALAGLFAEKILDQERGQIEGD